MNVILLMGLLYVFLSSFCPFIGVSGYFRLVSLVKFTNIV